MDFAVPFLEKTCVGQWPQADDAAYFLVGIDRFNVVAGRFVGVPGVDVVDAAFVFKDGDACSDPESLNFNLEL